MHAIELQAFGIEHLKRVERPDPVPGPLEVLVRMRYVSLNYRDLVTIAGGYGRLNRVPLIPLSDGAGEVLAVGAGVRSIAVGDRVMTCFFQDWEAGVPTPDRLASSLGGPLDGTLRELACFRESGLCKLPAAIELRTAASLPCAAVTAWNALAGLSQVGPSDTVLVQGTGGVSLFALQFARAMGARVIATSSSEQKLARLRELGASEVINYATSPDWGKTARALTHGRGVDHVIEVGGAGTLAQSLRAVRPGGTLSLIGVLAGAKHELHLPHVFMQQVRLQGVVVGPRERAEQMLRAIEAHAIAPVLDEPRFGFGDVYAALERMRAGEHFGKITLAIEE